MSGCLDNLRLPEIEALNCAEKRNKYASITAGILFALGWWLAIDAACVYPDKNDLRDVFHICGVFGTISMFMVNSVSNGQLSGSAYTTGCLGENGAKLWFFVGCLIGFGSLIGSGYILFGEYLTDNPSFKPSYTYPGVAIFMQNALIVTASLVYKFGRSEDNWA